MYSNVILHKCIYRNKNKYMIYAPLLYTDIMIINVTLHSFKIQRNRMGAILMLRTIKSNYRNGHKCSDKFLM